MPSDAQLTSEREHLLASIKDLDSEHAAGELSDEDYAALRSEYVARAAAALRAAPEQEEGAPTPPSGAGSDPGFTRLRRWLGRRTVRRWLGAGIAVCFVGLATVLALTLAGVRLPGEGVSGGVTLNQAQQIREELEQAQILGSSGQVSEALVLYQKVLAVEPEQPEALTYRGYLLCLDAQATKSPDLVVVGRDSIEEAMRADPGYGDAHFFYALVLLQDYQQKSQALAEFRTALSDHVSADLVQAERGKLEQLFTSLHQKVPTAVTSS
jgi:tetratricopeptide (TPR) repeat protein